MDLKTVNLDYVNSGVNIAAGEAAVKAIKNKVRTTYNSNVLGDLGSFGGLYRIDKAKWDNPVLVSSTDGVGTKLRVAIMAEEYDTIGQDLVNHCVNDILVQGAVPLFFLDYIGVGKLKPQMVEQVIDGLVTACRENGCALIGGEMAEMPGIYADEDFDLAGTIVGMVEQAELLPRQTIAEGDIIIGLPSSGLHTNGYSLVRKIVFDHLRLKLTDFIPECEATLKDLLLSIHKSYLPDLLEHLNNPDLHGLAHITGGGIAGNLSRILPDRLCADIYLPDNRIPALFRWLKKSASLGQEVMHQTFNLGIGMICVINNDNKELLMKLEGAIELGEISSAKGDLPKVRFL